MLEESRKSHAHFAVALAREASAELPSPFGALTMERTKKEGIMHLKIVGLQVLQTASLAAVDH